MVTRKNAPHFGHENPGTHSQSIQAAVVGNSKATAETILSDKGHAVASVRPGDSIHKATEVMKEHGIGSVVVKDQNGHLVGILTERDVVLKFAEQPTDTFDKKVSDIMTTDVITATPDTLLLDILHMMTKRRCRHIPIMDGDHIAGVISIGDAVRYRLQELEYEALKLKQMIVG